MLESKFQRELIAKLKRMFPGCEVQINDPSRTQGIPDLTILWNDKWAMLEVKKSAKEPNRPNQPYWVDYYNSMSFAAFIYPENEEQVLNELQRSLGSSRQTRVS
jgi:hypothetical protein